MVGFHALASAVLGFHAVGDADGVTAPLVQAAVHVFHVAAEPEPPAAPEEPTGSPGETANAADEPPGLPLRLVLHNVVLEHMEHVVSFTRNEAQPTGPPLQYR